MNDEVKLILFFVAFLIIVLSIIGLLLDEGKE